MAGTRGDTGFDVEHHVAELHDLWQSAAAAQNRPDPGHQLGQLKGFDDVVIGAAIEAAQPVRQGVTGGDQHNSGLAPASDNIDQGEAIPPGQHDVEHHQIRAHAVENIFQLGPVPASVDVVAGLGQRFADHFPNGVGVLDHQHARGADAESAGAARGVVGTRGNSHGFIVIRQTSTMRRAKDFFRSASPSLPTVGRMTSDDTHRSDSAPSTPVGLTTAEGHRPRRSWCQGSCAMLGSGVLGGIVGSSITAVAASFFLFLAGPPDPVLLPPAPLGLPLRPSISEPARITGTDIGWLTPPSAPAPEDPTPTGNPPAGPPPSGTPPMGPPPNGAGPDGAGQNGRPPMGPPPSGRPPVGPDGQHGADRPSTPPSNIAS